MAFQFLRDWGAPPEDIAAIISAIGQHDERSGIAFDPISAALILADKSDVRRDRVRNTVPETFDKHDCPAWARKAAGRCNSWIIRACPIRNWATQPTR